MFVSGPVGHERDRLRGRAEERRHQLHRRLGAAARRRARAAPRRRGRTRHGPRPGPRIPAQRPVGAAATGTSVRPRSVSTRSALRVVRARLALPGDRRHRRAPRARARPARGGSRAHRRGPGRRRGSRDGAARVPAMPRRTGSERAPPWPEHATRRRDAVSLARTHRPVPTRPLATPRFPWPRLDDTVTMRASDRPAAPGRSIDRATPGESSG